MEPQSQSENQVPRKESRAEEVKFGSLGLFSGIVIVIALFFILNYFNILSLSKVFPRIFGFLPHEPFAQKIINYSPAKLEKPSANTLESCSVKKEGNPLITDLRTEGNSIIGTYRGIINKITFNNPAKTSASIELVSLKGDQTHLFKVDDENGLVYDYTQGKDASLGNLKKGMSIAMTFNCFPQKDNLFKYSRIVVISKF